MSRQSEWQQRMKSEGRCQDCGNSAARKDDGTHYAYCPECREKRRKRDKTLPSGWSCPHHPGRRPVRSKIRRGDWWCGVRLVDGSRCQASSSDETPAEAQARLRAERAWQEQSGLSAPEPGIPDWRCSKHPDAIPRAANTPGHWYCAVRVYDGDPNRGYYCGESSAAETREQYSAAMMRSYRERVGPLPWEQDETIASPEDGDVHRRD